jgi:hypothetical protein
VSVIDERAGEKVAKCLAWMFGRSGCWRRKTSGGLRRGGVGRAKLSHAKAFGECVTMKVHDGAEDYKVNVWFWAF